MFSKFISIELELHSNINEEEESSYPSKKVFKNLAKNLEKSRYVKTHRVDYRYTSTLNLLHELRTFLRNNEDEINLVFKIIDKKCYSIVKYRFSSLLSQKIDKQFKRVSETHIFKRLFLCLFKPFSIN